MFSDDVHTVTDVSKPGHFARMFIRTPEKSTTVRITVNNHHKEDCGKYVLHLSRFKPQISFRNFESFRHFSVSSQSHAQFHHTVQEYQTLEVCFGKWWSCVGETATELKMEFDFVNIIPNPISLKFSDCITRIELANFGKHSAKLSPSVKINYLVQTFK